MANDTVDIAGLVRFFGKQKRKLFLMILFMIGVGLIVIFLTRNHYTSTLKFIAQSDVKTGNLMGQLGGLSGLNLGNLNSQEPGSLSPQLYQEIIYSYPFLWKLSQKPVEAEGKTQKLGLFIDNNRTPSIFSLIKKYTIGLPSVIAGDEKKPIDLESGLQDSTGFFRRELVPMFNEYKKIISLTNDAQSASMAIEVKSLSPEISAQMAMYTFEILSEYVIDFKTEKARQNMKFIEARFEEAKQRFYQTQNELSAFRDRNQNLSFSSVRTQEERLQAEYNLASSLYNNLAVQLDQAKIKVQEDIPQLSILNPPVVSYQPSKPNIPLIMAISVFMGVILGFFWVLISYFRIQFEQNK
jgi:Uncharacterized protein involved in exopolysaccharide biosynthesis